MKYNLSCPKCERKEKFSIQVEPENEGIYKIKCPYGHEFQIDILSQHFQVLFENGLQALSNKYFMESFTSFSSSYERFMEYFIAVINMSNNIPKEHFEKAWKTMSSRSERQQGAFVMIYLQEFKAAPVLLSNNIISLRNKVIHKGYFPNEKDCISYGNAILDFIRPIIQKLKENEKYEWYVIGSANEFGLRYLNKKITQNLPYQIFPTNREFNKADKKDLLQLLKDQRN